MGGVTANLNWMQGSQIGSEGSESESFASQKRTLSRNPNGTCHFQYV